MNCQKTDFVFPMYADLYYPIISQGLYGEIERRWVFDRTVMCNALSTTEITEQLNPDQFILKRELLEARTKEDIRISSNDNADASTNILITNIRFPNGEVIYKETAGARAGQGTLFEIAKLEPFIGPFNSIEYYQMVWRRTESQAVID